MTAEPLILALDVGTQSVRAALVDRRGAVQALAARPLGLPSDESPERAERDADDFHAAMLATAADLRAAHGAAWPAIAGVALTGQRASMVFVDSAGRPLRPAILWADRRRTDPLAPLGGLAGLGIRLAGAAGTVENLRAQAEVNWVATHEPQIWAATDKVLLLTSYLLYRLTGRFADSYASQVGYLPFDYRRHRWHRRTNWRWRALAGVRRRQMVDLHAPGTPLGPLTAEATEHLGLDAPVPVIASAADKACEVLGAGCLGPAQACLSYGTAATVNVPGPRYLPAQRFAPPYPAAVPGTYTTEIQIHRGFWLVSWFMREFGHLERGRAQRDGVPPESLLDDLLDASPPGAAGLVAQPYFAPGVREPGPEARGALIGFNDRHTRAHVYRALVEGIAFALHEGLARIETRARARVTNLRVAGGGAKSDAIMQMTADVFGLPAARPAETEASAVGAAVCAAVGLGWYGDFTLAARAMCHTGEVFEPDPSRRKLYADLIERVYRPLYGRLRPLYRALQRMPL